jgi:tRNA threonylcarbamoyl adenosine modification protein YeaZ
MVILALDTTVREGSVAVLCDGKLAGLYVGDPTQTHGERLPGDVSSVLDIAGVSLEDIELYAVAVGPGSFTGLRVGIATIQALALVHQRSIVQVSTLAAFAYGINDSLESGVDNGQLVGVWMDGQRGEVFSVLYKVLQNVRSTGMEGSEKTLVTPPNLDLVEEHAVGLPEEIATRWTTTFGPTKMRLAGNGAQRYLNTWESTGITPEIIPAPVSLAPAIGQLARQAPPEAVVSPHAIHPLYVRKPDVELTRERRKRKGET